MVSGFRKPSPVGRMSGFRRLQGVGLLNRLPNGNRTSVTAAGGAVASFEVSARAKKVLNFPPTARRRCCWDTRGTTQRLFFSWPVNRPRVSRWEEPCHRLAGAARPQVALAPILVT
jgi:hypothetical protein